MSAGLDLPSAGGGTEAGVPSPHRVRGETFKAESEAADLWQPKWNKNQTVLVAAKHTPERDPEFGDGGAIPELGLLLRWIARRRGRRLWWERPVEESRAAIKAR